MKLIKHNYDGWNHYYLINKTGNTIGTTKHPFPPEMLLISENKGISLAKLSLENCQAIERGYDLDKLLEEAFDNMGDHSTVTVYEEDQFKLGYKLGFQKALELTGDKKYTIHDIKKAFRAGGAYTLGSHKEFMQTHPDEKEYIQSLQETEWDVEIVQEPAKSDCGPGETNWYNAKLDKDGCLILKRVDNVNT